MTTPAFFAETLYNESSYSVREIEHGWGRNVHMVDDPLAWTFLARLSSPDTKQPEIGRNLRKLYERLGWIVLAAEFPRVKAEIPTRMSDTVSGAAYRGLVLDPNQKAVTVGVARAGTQPSQILYELLNEVLEPAGVRQDHLILNRIVDDKGQVTGTSFQGAKTGTEAEGRIILIPDPMGATGSTMDVAIDHYAKHLSGRPTKIIALHLIVTPEYLRRVTQNHPNLIVYALRYDRGLSPATTTKTPGTDPAERGLTLNHYIVPGAGGLGELLNNAW